MATVLWGVVVKVRGIVPCVMAWCWTVVVMHMEVLTADVYWRSGPVAVWAAMVSIVVEIGMVVEMMPFWMGAHVAWTPLVSAWAIRIVGCVLSS